MSQQDPYDFVDNPTPPPRRLLSTPMWISIVIAVALVAFALGLAVGTLATRFGRGAQTTIPVAAQTSAAATAVAVLGTPTLPVTATVAATTTPTPSPSPSPSPSATAVCAIQPDAQFGDRYDQAALGCATGVSGVYWAAWEPFERGAMFWRSDTNAAYAFVNDGRWQPVDQGWAGQDIPSRGEPPAGLQAPIRGFGYAWATSAELFNRLGWATREEKGFCALIQPFERGFMLHSNTVEFCQDELYNSAREPDFGPLYLAVLNDGQWQNLAASGSGAAPLPLAAGVTRPPENGRFVALANTPRLDTTFRDWPDQWSPIAVVAEGGENYGGGVDLRGAFQVAWSTDGLYFAVQVQDDRYRSGPDGSDMWQGDGLEIHIDRDLAADFANPQADGDDYQVGVSFDANRAELRGYRWLPTAQEGSFRPAGAVTPQGEGYNAEFLLPWALFDQPKQNLAQRAFGFMISLNDNDQDAPAQQSVLSTSLRRTTYNRPDEWGTLVLAGE